MAAPTPGSSRRLPPANNLDEAVQQVIHSNKKDGYVPSYFIREAAGKTGADLWHVCRKLLHSDGALSNIAHQLTKHPNILTIEDYVCRFGASWTPPFSASDVAIAQKSVDAWDAITQHQRYL